MAHAPNSDYTKPPHLARSRAHLPQITALPEHTVPAYTYTYLPAVPQQGNGHGGDLGKLLDRLAGRGGGREWK